MTLFIRFFVWVGITLIACLVTASIGMVMNGSDHRDDQWPNFAWIASVMILGSSLTVNLIQFGLI